MIIGVDLDDVLSETVLSFDKYIYERYGTALKKEDHYTFDLSKIWKITEKEYRRRIYEFNFSEYFENIKPMLEAKTAISKLSQNHKMVIITSRMEEFEKKTWAWLKKHFPDIDFELHHANHYYGMNNHKKSHICRKLGVDVLIDDCLEFAKECSAEKIPVLLFNQPWNQSDKLPKNITRVKDWNEVLKRIKEMGGK